MTAISAIKILDTHTINKIAAGEVVERPSSVVKELVENSIDAKASSITVEIKNGGIDFIRVTDNGIGIPKEEAEIAFLRHATSKIDTADDLMKLFTLGFRGEALASIASISHVELITKTEKEVTGKRIEVSGGKILSSEEIACPNGTTLIMRHIFYNVPARKEFLGSSSAESAKISDYITKLALAHPEISFKYIQNNKVLFTTSGNHDLTHCVLSLYGKETAKNTFKLYYKANGITCVGLLGNPTLTRANRNYEHFFINGRYIKSPLLQRAAEAAYKTLVMVNKFPFLVLHLHIDPGQVDVNVHPTKMQVRFKNEDTIYHTVYQAIITHLREKNLVPHGAPPKTQSISLSETPSALQAEQIAVDTFFAPRKPSNIPTPETLLNSGIQPVNEKELFNFKEEKLFGKTQKSTYEAMLTPLKGSEKVQETPSLSNTTPIQPADKFILEDQVQAVSSQNNTDSPYDELPLFYTIVGQLFNTYWLIQYEEKIFIMDQHAAHERVMYEKFLLNFKRGEVPMQLLLMPETFLITDAEKVLIDENSTLFSKLGFNFEPFGENNIIVREVPFIFNQPLSASIFKDILDTLSAEKHQDITSVKEETIIRMACRSAIKAHDKISEKECRALIESLLRLENPFTCPHGRPTLVALTKTDIEKMFKRI